MSAYGICPLMILCPWTSTWVLAGEYPAPKLLRPTQPYGVGQRATEAPVGRLSAASMEAVLRSPLNMRAVGMKLSVAVLPYRFRWSYTSPAVKKVIFLVRLKPVPGILTGPPTLAPGK